MDTYIRKTAFLVLLLLAVTFSGFAQQRGLYISGAIMEADSLAPLPGATVKNISTREVLQADDEGAFRIRVNPGDTLQIEHMLYRASQYFVPENLKASRYALIQLLQREDALEAENLREFPSQQQFEQTIMRVDPGNLTEKTAELDLHLERVTNDPTNMQKYLDDYRRHQRLYILPEEGAINHVPNDFINPDRWRNFVEDWREGRFTDEGINKLEGFPPATDDGNDQ